MTDSDLIIALEKRVTELEKIVFSKKEEFTPDNSELNWSLNERAFVTRYAKDMTGTEKFVLLVAYLAKGDTNMIVSLSNAEKLWNKMTAKSLLGMKFNRRYTSDAKSEGWVDSPAKGQYQLTYGWNEICEKYTSQKGEK